MGQQKFRVLGVLAGRYRANANDRRTVTHAVPVVDGTAGGGANAPICKRISADHMGDDYGAEDAGSVPTCPTCAKRLAKVGGEVIGRPE